MSFEHRLGTLPPSNMIPRQQRTVPWRNELLLSSLVARVVPVLEKGGAATSDESPFEAKLPK
eukprot:2287000-Amphidinium_carterae.1